MEWCLPIARQVVILEEGRVSETMSPARDAGRDVNLADPTMKVVEFHSESPLSDKVNDHPVGKLINARQLVETEKREAGLSGRKHLVSLLKMAGNVKLWLSVLVLAVFNDTAGIGHSALLARWSSHTTRHTDLFFATASIAITIIRGIGMFLLSASLFYVFTWKASGFVHENLLAALLRAPLQILQAIPTGRILNRFTQDMERFDMDLDEVMHETIRMGVGLTVVLAFTTKEVPTLLLVLVALVPVLYSLQWRLAKFLSDGKKLNSIWSSPMLTMVDDTEYAVTVIRAFGAVDNCNRKMRVLQTQKRMAGATEYAAWLLCRYVGSRQRYCCHVFLAHDCLPSCVSARCRVVDTARRGSFYFTPSPSECWMGWIHLEHHPIRHGGSLRIYHADRQS